MRVSQIFVNRHDLTERHTVLGVLKLFVAPAAAYGGAGQHHSPGRNSARHGCLRLGDEIVFQRTVNAEMRFRVYDAWEDVVSLGVDGFFRREATEIGCDGGDLFPFDPDTRRYHIRRDDELSICDY